MIKINKEKASKTIVAGILIISVAGCSQPKQDSESNVKDAGWSYNQVSRLIQNKPYDKLPKQNGNNQIIKSKNRIASNKHNINVTYTINAPLKGNYYTVKEGEVGKTQISSPLSSKVGSTVFSVSFKDKDFNKNPLKSLYKINPGDVITVSDGYSKNYNYINVSKLTVDVDKIPSNSMSLIGMKRMFILLPAGDVKDGKYNKAVVLTGVQK